MAKGLSGAVTALILVIASVIITLVVVGYVFGLFGAFAGIPSVQQTGTGTLEVIKHTKTYYLTAYITLDSSGKVQILKASIEGTGYSTSPDIQLTAGNNPVTITFTSSDKPSFPGLQPGTTYTISLTLSDGETVLVSVVYE